VITGNKAAAGFWRLIVVLTWVGLRTARKTASRGTVLLAVRAWLTSGG
jgi:hypothetical protein